jgi:hypothetical protein
MFSGGLATALHAYAAVILMRKKKLILCNNLTKLQWCHNFVRSAISVMHKLINTRVVQVVKWIRDLDQTH